MERETCEWLKNLGENWTESKINYYFSTISPWSVNSLRASWNSRWTCVGIKAAWLKACFVLNKICLIKMVKAVLQ